MATQTPTHPSRWLWLLPRLTFGLFVASVLTQLWLSERADTEEERATLSSDMLWLEQSLRFNLKHNEERLAQMGEDTADNAALFEANANALLNNNSGLRQILLLDTGGHVRMSQPGEDATVSAQAVDASRRLGKPAYSPPYKDETGTWLFQVQVPIFRTGHYQGCVTGIYGIRKILIDAVPWWLAQRNYIGIEDLAGQLLATHSQVLTESENNSHRISFDPPGQGLVLWAAPFKAPKPLSRWFLFASLILLATVVVWSMCALRRDMQRRQAAEQALREEHSFRLAMEDSLQTGLRARDLEGRITYVNPAFCRMVGYGREELVGQAPPMPYWADDNVESNQAMNDRILAGKGPRTGYETRLKRRSGETFPALIHTTPLINAQGEHTGWMSSIVDLTEQKRAEERERLQQERLQATSRLVAMGEMASSLAHELNQPLAAISSYATGSLNLIDSGQTDLTEIRGVLAKTQAQAQRAGQVIRRIYDFVRRAEPKTETCDIRQLVDETVSLVEGDARRRKVRIEKKLAADLPTIEGDRVLLGQALFNLIRNGIEAMTDKTNGLLTVKADADGDQVTLSIADRGPGIPPEVAESLFEPFYTTKEEGMGMGLNICRSIIEAHHGRLWLEPNPGSGSIFRVTLPRQRT